MSHTTNVYISSGDAYQRMQPQTEAYRTSSARVTGIARVLTTITSIGKDQLVNQCMRSGWHPARPSQALGRWRQHCLVLASISAANTTD